MNFYLKRSPRVEHTPRCRVYTLFYVAFACLIEPLQKRPLNIMFRGRVHDDKPNSDAMRVSVRGQLQCYTSATRTVIHITMRLNECLKREYTHVKRQQHTISSQLVDLVQGALHGFFVLSNAQFRFTGEVTNTVYKELNVLLEDALLTGLSCVHYGAFADLPEAGAVQAQILGEAPHLQEHGIHLLISPTPYGELIIGDSHDYGQDPSPFNAEQVDNWLIELAEHTLGCKVQVVERWQGVYGSRGPGPFSFLQAAPGVHAALMHTGVGMSVGPAMAESNISTLFGAH